MNAKHLESLRMAGFTEDGTRIIGRTYREGQGGKRAKVEGLKERVARSSLALPGCARAFSDRAGPAYISLLRERKRLLSERKASLSARARVLRNAHRESGHFVARPHRADGIRRCDSVARTGGGRQGTGATLHLADWRSVARRHISTAHQLEGAARKRPDFLATRPTMAAMN